MSRVLLTFVALMLQRNQGYVDEHPDPDFAPKHSKDNSGATESLERVSDYDKAFDHNEQPRKTERISGHYKFLINEILKRGILSAYQKELFQNADNVDPYSIAEEILKLLPDQNVEHPEQYGQFQTFLYDLNHGTIQKLLVIYAVTVFCMCYFSKGCRNFLISLHLILFYFYAVYPKINRH